MQLTKTEKDFLIDLINEYADFHKTFENVLQDSKGRLYEVSFDGSIIHDGLDINDYKIINSLLDKLY